MKNDRYTQQRGSAKAAISFNLKKLEKNLAYIMDLKKQLTFHNFEFVKQQTELTVKESTNLFQKITEALDDYSRAC
jgi:hypothetical protein